MGAAVDAVAGVEVVDGIAVEGFAGQAVEVVVTAGVRDAIDAGQGFETAGGVVVTEARGVAGEILALPEVAPVIVAERLDDGGRARIARQVALDPAAEGVR